ncbi:unnamed protein product [Rotaria sordida]|uniref:Uncharacterized protein n=1 Tax=Rotaria sordida TaxID=392033 RepID=A0A815UKI7_9BILA|nr:unnamed protein product [Rotaria sordida]
MSGYNNTPSAINTEPIGTCNLSRIPQSETSTINKHSIPSTELERMLCCGGDERLLLDSSTRVNMYGCSPGPVSSSTSIYLSSSTATPVSNDAFAHLAEMMITLNKTEINNAVDDRMEDFRQELLDYFGINSVDADIVFVPSGTDATLQAVFLSKLCLSKPTTILTNLVLAVDEAAGRVMAAASGCHFNTKNIRGEDVDKGAPIACLHGTNGNKTIEYIELSYEKCQNEIYIEELVDQLVSRSENTHVLLHAIDTSKLGNRTPSHNCLERIEQQHSKESLTILIDACQFRLSSRRIRDHINRGRLVIITGSKFLTGPPFSGAIIVPGRFRAQIQQASVSNNMSSELAAYSAIADWPRSWTNVRSCLSTFSSVLWKANIGQFLRWMAAVFELRRYLRVPVQQREQFILEAGAAIQAAFASVPDLLEPFMNKNRSQFFDEYDEEFRHPTIFPFLIRQPNKSKSFLHEKTCKEIYQKLQQTTDTYPITCVIGQPVTVVVSEYQGPVTTFRFSIDARAVADEFERGHGTKPMTVDILRSKVELVIKKIAEIVNFQQSTKTNGDDL